MVVFLVLAGFAQANLVYVPLDNRPPNWSPCNWGMAVCPPAELYKGRDGADPAALAQWLLNTPGEQLVVSLDALVYGGLVQSRGSDISLDEAKSRFRALYAWKVKYQGKVLVFGVIPRHPDAVNRARNLELLRSIEGFDYAEAPWDDALPGSPAIAEAATLPIPTRPGADEAGQVLLLRAIKPGLRVKVLYDDPKAAAQVTRYDGIPLEQSIKRLLVNAGALQIESNPDLVLMVYTGVDPRQAVLTLLRGMRQAKVAVADIAKVNRGDSVLVRYLVGIGIYESLAAYAAWGTPANNLGAALAQGGLFLDRPQLRIPALAQSYLEYLWGDVGRIWVRERFPEPLTLEAARYVFERLQREPTPVFGAQRLVLRGLDFPWKRSFEASWRYEFQPSIASGQP